jgi:hypothetical protein
MRLFSVAVQLPDRVPRCCHSHPKNDCRVSRDKSDDITMALILEQRFIVFSEIPISPISVVKS